MEDFDLNTIWSSFAGFAHFIVLVDKRNGIVFLIKKRICQCLVNPWLKIPHHRFNKESEWYTREIWEYNGALVWLYVLLKTKVQESKWHFVCLLPSNPFRKDVELNDEHLISCAIERYRCQFVRLCPEGCSPDAPLGYTFRYQDNSPKNQLLSDTHTLNEALHLNVFESFS